jgi:pimeloyl-ACP methyl ester carboxylesterase
MPYLQPTPLSPRFWYEQRGEGEPLVLLHGGTMTARWNWQKAIPVFAAERFRVIALDSPAHGKTNNPVGSLTYGRMTDEIVAFLAELGVEHACFYGFSDGAQIALEIGFRHPKLAKALVLNGVVLSYDAPYLTAIRKLVGVDKLVADGDLDRFAEAHPEWTEELRKRHTWAGEDSWRETLRQVWPLWTRDPGYSSEAFERLAAPTLVLTGDRDPMVPVDDALRIARRLDAELGIVPGQGHDTGEPFTRTALEFLLRRAR